MSFDHFLRSSSQSKKVWKFCSLFNQKKKQRDETIVDAFSILILLFVKIGEGTL